MSVRLISLDTNVLFYAIDKEAGARHRRAKLVVERAAKDQSCVLTLQSLCEFVAATTRKRKLSFAQAALRVEAWQTLFPVVVRTPDCLTEAMRGVDEYSLSFWDAMLWAIARKAGVSLLLSEDLQHE